MSFVTFVALVMIKAGRGVTTSCGAGTDLGAGGVGAATTAGAAVFDSMSGLGALVFETISVTFALCGMGAGAGAGADACVASGTVTGAAGFFTSAGAGRSGRLMGWPAMVTNAAAIRPSRAMIVVMNGFLTRACSRA